MSASRRHHHLKHNIVSAFMFSCAERSALRCQTLSDLRASDWDEEPAIEIDQRAFGQAGERIPATAFRLLVRAIETGSDIILFLEGDLRFNRHLRANLGCWHPLAGISRDCHFFGSLYYPRVRELERRSDLGYFLADPRSIFGSQALIFSWATGLHLVKHWHEVDGLPDFRMSRLAADVCPIYYHVPSLVQHVGHSSTWGGPYHRAHDFRPDWKAQAVS
jgi:hypothetical protein